MKKNYSSTFHLPVVSVANEAIIASLYRFIIDWSDMHIVAVWVKTSLTHKKVILWSDIQELSNGWYVQSEDALSEPAELVRLEPVMDTFFNIKGATCKLLDETVLGKVSDFTFEDTTGQILKIMIQNHLLKPIAHELILPISAIKKVENETIYVDELEKKEEMEAVTQIPLPVANYV